MSDYYEWKKRIDRKYKLLTSQPIMELHLCMIEQGYVNRVLMDYLPIFGSCFPGMHIIKKMKENYLNE